MLNRTNHVRRGALLAAALLCLSAGSAAAKDKRSSPHFEVIGTYDGVHPHWRDTVHLSSDGRYRRGNGDPGSWTFDGQTLVLDWDNWGVARLVKQSDDTFFDGKQKFRLTRRAEAPKPEEVSPSPKGAREILNRAQGLCLDVEGKDGARGKNVALWDCDGGADQTWTHDGQGRILNAASGLCLDVAGRDGARGKNVALWDCDGGKDQQWDFVQRGGQSLVINRAQNLCLDAAGREGKRGDNVALWDCDGGIDQSWSWAEPEREKRRKPEMVRPQPKPSPVEKRRQVARAMDEDAFSKVLAGMENAGFEAGKVEAFKVGTSGQHLTCAQLVRAIGQLSFSASQKEIVEHSSPRVLDRENREEVVSAFTFSADQSAVRKLLQ